MLSIRLSRIGKKKQPSYRLIVCQKQKDPWGDCLETLGNYNPRTSPKTVEFKVDRVKYWLDKGAQPSDTVRNLLIDLKVIEWAKAKATKISGKRAGKIAERKKVEEEAKAAKVEEKPEAIEEAKAEEPKEEAA